MSDINPVLLSSIINSSSGSFFFNKDYNLIEELNINSLAENESDGGDSLTKFFSLMPSFPNLRYVSISSPLSRLRLTCRFVD